MENPRVSWTFQRGSPQSSYRDEGLRHQMRTGSSSNNSKDSRQEIVAFFVTRSEDVLECDARHRRFLKVRVITTYRRYCVAAALHRTAPPRSPRRSGCRPCRSMGILMAVTMRTGPGFRKSCRFAPQHDRARSREVRRRGMLRGVASSTAQRSHRSPACACAAHGHDLRRVGAAYTGSVKPVPELVRMALGSYRSVRPEATMTADTPAASAQRNTAPKLPGFSMQKSLAG